MTESDGAEHPRSTTPQGAAASIETVFEQLVGRKPTEPERERLYRLRQVLGLRDNDAFWSIVMALEHYDAFFRAYPAQLAEVTERAVENVRAASAAAAHEEVAAVQRALAAKVAETSVELAHKLAHKPLRIHQLTGALAAVVAFGSLCVHAGYELSMTGVPSWVHAPQGASDVSLALARVLSVPAGWMVFALLMPAAAHGVTFGWRLAGDPLGEWHERAIGGCIVGCCVMGGAVCAAILARLA
jgi:hypothetical protein